MFAKLKVELEEMQQIASPAVAMDIKNGKLHEVSLFQHVNKHITAAIDMTGDDHSDKGDISALQTELAAVLAPTSGHVLHKASKGAPPDPRKVSGLILETQQASQALRACLQSTNPLGIALLQGTAAEFKLSTKKQSCEESFGKTYKPATVAQVADW